MVYGTYEVFVRNENIVKDEFTRVGAAHAEFVEFSGTTEPFETFVDHKY